MELITGEQLVQLYKKHRYEKVEESYLLLGIIPHFLMVKYVSDEN